jgi:hypothetical protein
MTNTCFLLDNNFTEISNNKYIFNNNFNNSNSNSNPTDVQYGLYENSGNSYLINNIPRKYPIGFYSNDVTHGYDISRILTYSPINDTIIIYVSSGDDFGFENGDYFRFYDASYNLINISFGLESSTVDSFLTNSGDNFYFMRNQQYRFITTTNYSNTHRFGISGAILSNSNDYSLNEINDQFDILIPFNANNTNYDSNFTIYYHAIGHDLSVNLQFLVDSSDINYYYGDISFIVDLSYSTDFNNVPISIKSYPLRDISNNNIFTHDNACGYVIKQVDEYSVILQNKSRECLNYVSKINFADITNSNIELNTGKHIQNPSVIGTALDYGIYDGSYVIFNIPQNYPIDISINNDCSDCIYINENYLYTEIDYSQDQPFYYGAINIIVKDINNKLSLLSDYSCNLLVLNAEINTIIEITNKLIYTNLCEEPTIVNGLIINDDASFALFNQKGDLYYDISFYSIENQYNLNKYENYVELNKPYQAYDKYGHDITNLVESNIVIYTENINYNLTEFIIPYTVIDYEGKYYQIRRYVKINESPFIEISSNIYHIFNNNNPYTNIIEINSNESTFDNIYNFIDNISVYANDYISSNENENDIINKISLPFNITISGNYYSPIYNQPTQTIYKKYNYDYYDGFNENSLKLFLDDSNFNYYNYYLSYYKNLNSAKRITDYLNNIGSNGLKIDNINSYQIIPHSDQTPNILYNKIKQNNNQNHTEIIEIADNNNNSTITLGKYENITFKNRLVIKNIDNSLSTIYFSQRDENAIFDLSSSLYITNTEFKYTVNDLSDSDLSFVIEGSFNSISFFDSTDVGLIDLSYIGNYEIIIEPKGLSSKDYIYENLISENLKNAINPNTIISRTIYINVVDKINPTVKFVNNDTDLSYKYNYPNTQTFNIIDDVDFSNNNNFNLSSNKPRILYTDNSIYDGSLNFTIDSSNNVEFANDSSRDISVSNTDQPAEAIITYFATDLCGNKSNLITLTIHFQHIPVIELSGSNPTIIYFDDTSYIDAGINIKLNDTDISLGFEISFNLYNNGSDLSFDISNYLISDISYDICYNSDICFGKIGSYDVSYAIRYYDKTVENYYNIINRKTHIEKYNPFFRFHDLSSISYITKTDLENNIYLTDSSYVDYKEINPLINPIIDFSLLIFSDFEDLSKIIHAYDVSDSYPYISPTDLKTEITLTLTISGQISDVSFSLFELSNNGYIDPSTNKLSQVTKGVVALNPLIVNYSVIDTCFNESKTYSFDVSRTIHIIDISSPIIIFRNELSDTSYIDFGDDNDNDNDNDNHFVDFSFSALDYSGNNLNLNKLKDELNSVIFQFDLSDNYNTSLEISRNFIITVSAEDFSKIRITDISTLLYKLNPIDDTYTDILDISLLELFSFSNIDNSFTLIYDFSDNQYNNGLPKTRKVNIFNNTPPSIIFFKNLDIYIQDTSYDDNSYISISFGDISYNPIDHFTINHERLNVENMDLSYTFNISNQITSISGINEYGFNEYDFSALIYNVSSYPNLFEEVNYEANYDISFFAVLNSDLTTQKVLKSDTIKLNVKVINHGPVFSESDPTSLTVEAVEYISDASLIFDISAYSIYDAFYYYRLDLSYIETPVYISNITDNFNQTIVDPILFQQAPEKGEYTIQYISTDKNGEETTISRQLIILDTKGPIFRPSTLQNSIDVNVKQFETYTESIIEIQDYASDLSYFAIYKDYRNTGNIIYDHNFSTSTKIYEISNVLILSEEDTQTLDEIPIIYYAIDVSNNETIIETSITITKNNKLFLYPKLDICNNLLSLDVSFNTQFQYLLNTNIDLSNIYDINDIIYDNENKIITYEATTYALFNNLTFKLDVLYYYYADTTSTDISIINYNDTYDNVIIVNNIIPDIVNNYNIMFSAYETTSGIYDFNTSNIKFNVKDTTNPNLNLVDGSSNNNFENKNHIILPLLSSTTYTLVNDDVYYINHLINNNLNKPYIFTRNNAVDNSLIFAIEGIYIDDIVNKYVITDTNDTLDISPTFKEIYDLSITYLKCDLSNGIYIPKDPTNIANIVNNTDILTVSGSYIQTYKVIEINNIENSSDISRIITVERFKPFINLNYENDANGHQYKKLYHRQYSIYEDLGGNAYDYYDGSGILAFDENNIIKNINENILGEDYILFHITNNNTDNSNTAFDISRIVHVVNIESFKINNEFSDIFNLSTTYGDIENNRFGLFGGDINTGYYTINIDNSKNAIRIFGYDSNSNSNSTIDLLNAIDISNLIEVHGTVLEEYDISNDISLQFYWGQVTLIVKDDFNRASIQYRNNPTLSSPLNSTLTNNILPDIFLYDFYSETFKFSSLFDTSINFFTRNYIVDVSNEIPNHDPSSCFTIADIDQLSGNSINIQRQPTLLLPIGKYRFYQSNFNNFYNPMQFSITQDGPHNSSGAGKEYTKNIQRFKLPGFSRLSKIAAKNTNPYVEIIIDATTPSPLYYYSKNIKDMGGKIEIQNNIILHQNFISLNGYVLTAQNATAIDNIASDGTITLNGLTDSPNSNKYFDKNKIFLSQHFDISHNTDQNVAKETKHFIGVTQQNINHNLIVNNNQNRIIFKKYSDKADNISITSYERNNIVNGSVDFIRNDISNNYLFDTSINQYASNLLFYDYQIALSGEILKKQDDVKYELDALQLYYLNRELMNYYHYFIKNKILNERINRTNFIYKIPEIKYVNHVNLLDNDKVYTFFEDRYLSSNRLIFDSIVDNFIEFSLLTYIDLSSININPVYLNYLKNNVFNINQNPSNYAIDSNNLLFNEFSVKIFSDISGKQLVYVNQPQSIIFSDGAIEFNEYLIDSSNTKNLLYNLYGVSNEAIEIDNINNINNINNILDNRIFLSIKNTIYEENDELKVDIIGLTQQNIYHNMYIEDNKFIFHKYDVNTNNYQINQPGLTIEQTLNDLSNNNKFLLTISSEDIYNCFNQISDTDSNINIYNNSELKNLYMIDNDIPLNPAYKSIITYFIKDELDNSNTYLETLDIRPRSLNNVNYTTYNYTYPTELQYNHSHTYKIDLNEYFYRYLYDISKIKIPYNVINLSNLIYNIIDISYVKSEFNMYDLGNNQLIIYDKKKIDILNYLKSYIYIVNYKLDYLYKIVYETHFFNKNMLYPVNENEYELIYDISAQTLNTLYNEIGFISTSPILNLNNNSLNTLFATNFYNSKKVLEKFNLLSNNVAIFNTIFNPIVISYEDIISFENTGEINNAIDQILTDMSLVELNIDSTINNIFLRYNLNDNTLFTIFGYHLSYADFNSVNNDIYYESIYHNLGIPKIYEILNTNIDNFNLLLFRMRLRNPETYSIIEKFWYDDISSSVRITNILDTQTDINNFILNFGSVPQSSLIIEFSNNIVLFNDGIIEFIKGSDLSINYDINISDNSFSDIDINSENLTSFKDFSGLLQNIDINMGYINDMLTLNFDNIDFTYSKINYLLNSSELLINSFTSNNILLKFDINYNSYLFPNQYLDTIILDIAIPDITPPTIIFNNNDLSFSQNSSSLLTVEDEIIKLLIDDISYIDINQNNPNPNPNNPNSNLINDSINNINNIAYQYIDISYLADDIIDPIITVSGNIYSLIEIDIRNIFNIDFGNNNFKEINITYNITDNANNKNAVSRKILIERFYTQPLFQYFNIQTISYENIENFNNRDLLVNDGDSNDLIISKAANNVQAIDPHKISIQELTYDNGGITIDISMLLPINYIDYIHIGDINYTAFGTGINNTKSLSRKIIITPEEDAIIKKQINCCYPKVYYKPIQHNYKLGSANSSAMRMTKIIVNNRGF